MQRVAAITLSDPLDPDCIFGAIMNEAHLNKVLGYIELDKEQGAEPILSGKQVLQETGGFYLCPTIFD